MAENDQAQERTEQPTQKRLDEARRKGHIPRSRDLTAAAVMLTGGTAYLSDTTVVRNTTGITTASGTAISLGDNRVTRNATNGSFSASMLKQ